MPLRAAVMLALAALAVHELRYLLVPNHHADAGHGYLVAAPAVLAGLLALAAGRALAALGARRTATPVLTWAGASGALLGIHTVQEGLEHTLAGAGPIDAGLIVVIPLSLAAGALVALALRRTDRLLRTATAPARAPRLTLPAAVPALVPAPRTGACVATGIARHLAGRSPPAFG